MPPSHFGSLTSLAYSTARVPHRHLGHQPHLPEAYCLYFSVAKYFPCFLFHQDEVQTPQGGIHFTPLYLLLSLSGVQLFCSFLYCCLSLILCMCLPWPGTWNAAPLCSPSASSIASPPFSLTNHLACLIEWWCDCHH